MLESRASPAFMENGLTLMDSFQILELSNIGDSVYYHM